MPKNQAFFREFVQNQPRAALASSYIAAFLLLSLLLHWLGVQEKWLAQTLPDLHTAFGEETFAARYFGAGLISAALLLNWWGLSFLPRLAQILVLWSELLALLLLFFYSFDLSFEFIGRKIEFLITRGVMTTLFISAVSICIATVIALIGAVAKLSNSGVAYGLATFYTSLFRGLPLLMQIYLIYLGLPQIGYVVDAVPAGIAALSLCYGAYMTEIFRAGIESINKGQSEAAYALGLGRGQTMGLIVLPQAMRIIVPPTGNQFIAMLKDSSLVSVVGVWELLYLARTQGQTEFRHIEMLITASLIYWIMSIVLELAQSRIEKHFGKSLNR